MAGNVTNIFIVHPGSSPDVDSDFNTKIRTPVYEHTQELYGSDKVANIATQMRFGSKAAFKAMCSIYSIPPAAANKMTALIPPPIEGVECKIADIFNPSSSRYPEGGEFRAATEEDYWKKIIDGAMAIEGRISGTGAHACGVIMSSRTLSDVVPTKVRKTDGRLLTQWAYPECESLGLIKMDFLGLDTVDLIQDTVEYIKRAGKTPPNMLDVINGPMDDKATFEMLCRGDTIGIFQLAGSGVQDLLRKMQPDSIHDIAAATALYRPGPMGMLSHVRYAERKSGREEIGAPVHEDFVGSPLEEILKKTFNVVIFQEQVIQIANQIAGMTLQEGDDLRKAMGKKKVAAMAEMKPKFLEGARQNGYSDEAVNLLWDTVAEFSKYGFNKCASGYTKLAIEGGGKITIAELFELQNSGKELPAVLSMWEDGEIRPHAISKVVKTGRKELWTVRTASGRRISITEEHRMLTTSGYRTIADGGLKPGVELMNDDEWTSRISPETRAKRSNTMGAVNRMPAMRQSSSERMIDYQSTLTFADRSAHQQRVQAAHPERGVASLAAGRAKLSELHKDPQWSLEFAQACDASRAKLVGKTRGYGVVTEISDGRICDSMCEAMAAEYLLERGVDFELHKPVPSLNGGPLRISDFYANGIYYEMDGLQRGRQYFVDNKYGEDVPFVYLTPQNFRDVIDESLMAAHATNGDEIVEISAPKTLPSGSLLKEMSYDIEMKTSGPSNFIAEGLVSHNSHSYSYAIMAYQAAWLKANYPVEFMAALLAINVGSKDKILVFLKECRRMGLTVGTSDVNKSDVRVAPNLQSTGPDIVYGLSSIDSVSETIAEAIVKERDENGLYESLSDFVDRCSATGVARKNVFVHLAYAGSFDDFGVTRKAVVDAVPHLMGDSKVKSKRGVSLFDMFGGEEETLDYELGTEEYSFPEMIELEASVIGLYLTSHPLERVGDEIGRISQMSIEKLLKSPNRVKSVQIAGAITDLESKIMSRGKSITVSIDDGTGYLEARLTPDFVKALDKTTAQASVKKLYMTGANKISDYAAKSVRNPVAPSPELRKNRVYRMVVDYVPGIDGGNPRVRLLSAVPVLLAHDGTLPIRMRFDAGTNKNAAKLQRALPAKVAEKWPGDAAIFTASFDSRKGGALEPDQVFLDALQVLDEADVNAKKAPREWPPPRNGATSDYKQHVPQDELADLVEYEDTGLRTDKTKAIEMAIEKFLGAENYDFGALDSSIFE